MRRLRLARNEDGLSAKPDLLKGIAVGDKVDFDLTVTGSGGEVTAIKRHRSRLTT